MGPGPLPGVCGADCPQERWALLLWSTEPVSGLETAWSEPALTIQPSAAGRLSMWPVKTGRCGEWGDESWEPQAQEVHPHTTWQTGAWDRRAHAGACSLYIGSSHGDTGPSPQPGLHPGCLCHHLSQSPLSNPFPIP